MFTIAFNDKLWFLVFYGKSSKNVYFEIASRESKFHGRNSNLVQ